MERMFESASGCEDNKCCSTPDCRLEPPKWEPVERCCEPSPCEERCAPRTRARDAIKVDRMSAEACYLIGNYRCDEKPLPLIRSYLRMDIRRKGYCRVLMCQPPTRVRNDGAICFDWLDEFRDLPTGYYEGDIYIDGCLCLTLLFYLPPCQARVLKYDMTEDDGCHKCSTCGEEDCRCGLTCCDRKPEYDDEYVPIPAQNCKDCEEC